MRKWVTPRLFGQRSATISAEAYLPSEVFRILSHHVKKSNWRSASVGGYPAHADLLAGLSRTITIANWVENVKPEISKWAKHHKDRTSVFACQAGYGNFSVSHALKSTLGTQQALPRFPSFCRARRTENLPQL